MFNYYKAEIEKVAINSLKTKVPQLNAFNLSSEKINMNGTPAMSYTWTDPNKNVVARFKTFDWWDGKNVCDLEISPDYRNKGLSYKLLDHATKDLGVKNLAVEKHNKIAKHVYDKYGFAVTDSDKDMYYMSLK